MRRRWFLALAGLAVLLAGLSVAATLRYLLPQIAALTMQFESTDTQADIDAFYAWAYSGWPYGQLAPWLLAAALLVVITMLALAGHRAQLAGSASATASRDASSD